MIDHPRGNGFGVELPKIDEKLEIGKGRILKDGKKVAILNFGARLNETLLAGDILSKRGIKPTIIDARFSKPLDEKLIWQVSNDHELLLTIEEGSIGGFGSHVSQYLADKNLLDSNLKFRSMFFPDRFIDQDNPNQMYRLAGLDSTNIAEKIFDALNSKILIKKIN